MRLLLLVIVISIASAVAQKVDFQQYVDHLQSQQRGVGGFLRKVDNWVEKVKRVIDPSKTPATPAAPVKAPAVPASPPAAADPVGTATATVPAGAQQAASSADAADADKKKSDDMLSKLDGIWKDAGDALSKAKAKLASNPLDTAAKKLFDDLTAKYQDASDKLASGQKDWSAAKGVWSKVAGGLKGWAGKLKGAVGPLLQKVGKAIEGKSLSDDLKAKADELKEAIDSAWLKAKKWLEQKLAELKKDPANTQKKAAAQDAQLKFDAASAAKVDSDKKWQESNTNWSSQNGAWKAGWPAVSAGAATTASMTGAQCSSALQEKASMDNDMRKAHDAFRKAWGEFKKKGDAKLDDLKTALDSLQGSMADWETRTSGWCDKGMYCSKGGPQTPITQTLFSWSGDGTSCPGYSMPPIAGKIIPMDAPVASNPPQ